ncbi:hypothetical protein OG754_38580 [Streptomyces decoyicus]|uniref:hypothetical protein n=1 Tax=Streptomyces decoyicus TaxID=249567 RepID=UPI002E36B0E7|nr:hypothetical protein [Streptomyces decoyicus]
MSILIPARTSVWARKMNGPTPGAPLPVAPAGLTTAGTTVDVLRAEHGFSAMVEISTGRS